ncbi:aspartyl-phosphate phosphatase Spo0E family protein [Aciduricibacillus chroicocephali]
MIRAIKNNGINSRKALRVSQELDTLIAEYQKTHYKCH